jgi:hypothetical protein
MSKHKRYFVFFLCQYRFNKSPSIAFHCDYFFSNSTKCLRRHIVLDIFYSKSRKWTNLEGILTKFLFSCMCICLWKPVQFECTVGEPNALSSVDPSQIWQCSAEKNDASATRQLCSMQPEFRLLYNTQLKLKANTLFDVKQISLVFKRTNLVSYLCSELLYVHAL